MCDDSDRRRDRADPIVGPAWAGLLSRQERRHLDTLARQWAPPECPTARLQALVEAALAEAASTYDRATRSDFLAHALLTLRGHIRRSRRQAWKPPGRR
jgi:hypothetical protein